MADPVWKRKGFKNYYEYRNYLARLEGYKSYYFQRRAREAATKLGDLRQLKGSDVAKYAKKAGKAVSEEAKTQSKEAVRSAIRASKPAVPVRRRVRPGDAKNIPSPDSFPRTRLYELENRVDEIPIGLISRKKFDGRYPKAGTVVNREVPRYRDQVDRHFPSKGDMSKNPDSFVMAAYKAGLSDSLPEGTAVDASVLKQAYDQDSLELNDLNNQANARMRGMLSTYQRNARNWDTVAAKVKDKKGAERVAKRRIFAYENPERTYRQGLTEGERAIYNSTTAQAYTAGIIRGWNMKGFEYFEVYDGPGCGWESHNDPQKANGMVVTAAEARANPQAHNYCVRTFVPITDPDRAKERFEEAKKERLTQKQRQISPKTKAIAAGATAAAAFLALSAEITTPAFSGTLGDFAINGIAVGLRRALGKMLELKDRAVMVMQRRLAARGFGQRLTQVAREVGENEADDNVINLEERRAALADQLHDEVDQWDEASDATGAGISELARRVLGLRETATKKLVGDEMGRWEQYYRLNFKNEVFEDVPGASGMADFLESQSTVNDGAYAFLGSVGKNAALNSAKYKGRFFRFSLPRINTIDGNTGKRVTKRYGRAAVAPNRFAHLHATALPDRDGSVRTILNARINPNGVLRLGFTKGENGMITPNLSLVPKGPIRVYSRANRAKPTKTVTREGITYVNEPKVAQRIGPDLKVVDSERKLTAQEILDSVEKAKRTSAGYEPDLGDVNAVRTNIGLTDGEINTPGPNVRRVIGKVTEEVPNPVAGRVNSITTEVRIVTKWVPFNDFMWYKFRVQLRALDIRKPGDLLDLTVGDFRRWQALEGDKFTWLSAGTKIRLRGGNLFDFSRSLRVDPTTAARIRNIEKNSDSLMQLFTEGIPRGTPTLLEPPPIVIGEGGYPTRASVQARKAARGQTAVDSQIISTQSGILGRKPAEQSFVDYGSDQVLNLAELYLRSKYFYTNADVQGIQDEFGDMVKKLDAMKNENAQQLGLLMNHSPWEIMQYKWHLVKKNVESRAEQLTDYLVTMRRVDARPDEGIFPRTEVLKTDRTDLSADQKVKGNFYDRLRAFREYEEVEIKGVQDEIEKLFWQKPDLITAILEASPKQIAEDIGDRLPNAAEVQSRVRQRSQDLWNRYSAVLPEKVRDRIVARLERMALFNEDLINTVEVREHIVGQLRFFDSDTSRVFVPGSSQNAAYSLRKGFRVGDNLDLSEYGELRLYGSTPESLTNRRPKFRETWKDTSLPKPYTVDDEGYRFMGWHLTSNPDFEYDPDFAPVGSGQPGFMFSSMDPRQWAKWAGDQGDDASNLYAVEVWSKGPDIKKAKFRIGELRPANTVLDQFDDEMLAQAARLEDESLYSWDKIDDIIPKSSVGRVLADDPGEIVEFMVEGESTQKYVGGIPHLHGKYQVSGYTRMTRNPDRSPHGFPEGMPDDVNVVHRIYIRQRGEAGEDVEDLVRWAADEPLVSAADHTERYTLLRRAFPSLVDAINEYMANPSAIADAYRDFKSGGRMFSDYNRRIAERVKSVIDNAPVSPNNLYRVYTGEDGLAIAEELQRTGRMKELFGQWSTTTEKFPRTDGVDGFRLMLVLRDAPSVNVTPMLRDVPPLPEVLSSGNYSVAQRYDDVSTRTTWIFLDYKRPF